MNTLRSLQAVALVCFCLSAGFAAGDTTGAAPTRDKASNEVKIPQVIVIGKRLNAEQKARMAQQENDQRENKVMSRKSPRKAAKLTRNAG